MGSRNISDNSLLLKIDKKHIFYNCEIGRSSLLFIMLWFTSVGSNLS